ncbi:MAG: family phosphatase [Clostridia bacterium]|jgi:Cof subfamily protein (haloacid dehalogenase superfamily)|nr:family phosphatase [Clostridia bacterium]
MIKLIASDMDGTLLNNKGELSPEFYELFKVLRKKNILFVAASGRQYFTLVKTLEAIRDDVLFIAENGTLIIYQGKELALNALDNNIAKKLIQKGRTIDGVDIVVCTKAGAYVERTSEKFINEVEKYYVKYQVIEDLMTVQGDILKVTLCDFKGAETNSNQYFDDLRDELHICIAGEHWLDMMAKGVNKGSAIKHLQQLLNIKYEETAAFGDYLNDLEMLQNAYYSYAMDNAHSDLKKIARYTAKSNEQNGVIEKIKELLK